MTGAPSVTLYKDGRALVEWQDGTSVIWPAAQVRRILRSGKGGTCPPAHCGHEPETCARCALKRAVRARFLEAWPGGAMLLNP